MYSHQWRQAKLLHFLNDSGVMHKGRISFFFCSFFRFFFSRRRGLLYEKLTLTSGSGFVWSWEKLRRGEEGVNFEQRLCDVSCEQSVKYTYSCNIQDLSENTLNKISINSKLAWIQIDISCFLFYVINLSNQYFTCGNMLFVYLGFRINDLILF